MSTTRTQISAWFDDGQKLGATHMIVVCDTFDHEDYPMYVMPKEDVREVYEMTQKESMLRVMEVYDLRMGKTEQVETLERVFNF